jgi:hypothetical protein
MLGSAPSLYSPRKVKWSLSTPWRHIGGVEVWLHSCLTLAVYGDEWWTSHPSCFNSKKESLYPLNRRLCGPQSQSGHFGEEKSLAPTTIQTPGHPAHSVVTIVTTLPRLPTVFWCHQKQWIYHPELWCYMLWLWFPETMVYFMRYEILKVMPMQITVKLCSLVWKYWYFRETCYLHCQAA